jgi:hypothetical protein
LIIRFYGSNFKFYLPDFAYQFPRQRGGIQPPPALGLIICLPEVITLLHPAAYISPGAGSAVDRLLPGDIFPGLVFQSFPAVINPPPAVIAISGHILAELIED